MGSRPTAALSRRERDGSERPNSARGSPYLTPIDRPDAVQPIAHQALAFGVVGVVGFIVDASVLWVAIRCGLGLYGGRLVSYLAAVTATWALNRRYTFSRSRSRNAFREWGSFVVSQLSGAAVNFIIYAAMAHFMPLVARYPVIGVAAGSLGGMVINFAVARAYVFKRRP
jgi:putative flippase GtrA